MKKFILCGFIGTLLVFGGNASAASTSLTEKVALWPVNRILDALDIFTVSVGLGLAVRAELMATELCKVGGGVDMTGSLVKDFNRQYGIGVRNGWYWSFITVQQEQLERIGVLGSVDSYDVAYVGVPIPNEPLYEFFEGSRDYWRIGGALGLIVEGELYVHPSEVIDLAAGILFIDIRGDDLIVEDFSRLSGSE